MPKLGRSPEVWWHLLSLDAPTVAVLWCWFFAVSFGVRLGWIVLPTLALGTWCVYVADRLLDGLHTHDLGLLRERHWFYLRHRRFFTIAWVVAAIPLAYLILLRVQNAVRTDDIVLGMIGVLYFLLIHAFPLPPARWFPKELAVGFLFAIATAVPAWARLNTGQVGIAESYGQAHGTMAVAVFCFGAICWLNCVAIQVWEDADVSQLASSNVPVSQKNHGPGSKFNRALLPAGLTPFLGRHLLTFASILSMISLVLAAITFRTATWPLFACITVSSLLFLVLIRNSQRLGVLSLRIAADAVLLTPLLFMLHLR